MPRTKIIATLGPASNNKTILTKMFKAGLDVVRLNFSHGNYRQHLERIELVRQLNKKYRRHIRIMQDLEGLRIRVGKFSRGRTMLLKNKTVVWLSNEPDAAGEKTIPFDYHGDLSRLRTGQLIYIDDGNICLRVKSSTETSIKATVLEGGILKEHKGVNIPDVELEFEGITAKDKKDIEFGIKNRVDYVALSFVRNAADVLQAADLIKPARPGCKIVAKIENRQAINNIDSIIEAADGIMIARGDMGVSLPIFEVPVIQKCITKKCNTAGKFVITATQMLEHMAEHTRPLRAEVSDIANAIIDGSDFLMLSAETAVGKYPAQSVAMMNDIIKFTEKSLKNPQGL